MAITGASEDEYREFLSKGGELTVIIDQHDLAENQGFEESALIKPYLQTGFELKPSPIIEDPEAVAAIYLHGDDWTRVIAAVYLRQGQITYRKLPDGKYEAKMSIPRKGQVR